MNKSKQSRRSSQCFELMFLVVVLGAFSALPASAGGKGQSAKSDTTTTETTTDATYVGSLDPTNVAIVSSDMYSFSMDTNVESLLQTDLAHTVATGKGVTVAVLDGGFSPPSDEMKAHLSGNQYDAVDDDSDPFDPGNGIDDDRDGIVDNARGHGTFVAGMVATVAPDADILLIRVADDEGRVLEQWLYDGIEHAVNAGVDVINLSLEMQLLSDTTVKMLYYAAKNAGILIVVSAGNDASDGALGALADSQLTIAVGAVDDTRTIADFTNFESNARWADSGALVYAPGVDLLGPCGFPYEDSACLWSGTSFAAGLVSGAAALGLEFMGGKAGDVWAEIQRFVDPVYDFDGQELGATGQINLVDLLHASAGSIESTEPTYETTTLEPTPTEPTPEEPTPEEPTPTEPTTEEPTTTESTTTKLKGYQKRR